jgi:hypothetical protein
MTAAPLAPRPCRRGRCRAARGKAKRSARIRTTIKHFAIRNLSLTPKVVHTAAVVVMPASQRW